MAAPFYVPRVDVNSLRGNPAAVNTSTSAVMVNGTTTFNVFGGPIVLEELFSLAITANDATASTLQWSADGDVGAATTFTGATATLASAIAGTIVATDLTALTTAPAINTAGVGLASVKTRGIIIPAGIITTVIGVGSTTGRWQHFMRYRPMINGAYVVAAF